METPAFEIAQRIGAGELLARHWILLALQSSAMGDIERCRDAAERAIAAASDAGEPVTEGFATVYEASRAEGEALTKEEAVAWVRRARSSRKRPSGGWESLTPTELQVVELLAEGLTNPQIGERMFISRAPVKVHLAHVFQKLAVKTRAQLSGQAVRRQG